MSNYEDEKTKSQRDREEWRKFLAEGLANAKRNGTMKRTRLTRREKDLSTLRQQYLADLNRDAVDARTLTYPLITWSTPWQCR